MQPRPAHGKQSDAVAFIGDGWHYQPKSATWLMGIGGNLHCILQVARLPGARGGLGPMVHILVWVLARWFAGTACALVLLSGDMLLAEQLLWHEVRLDSRGKLLSWVETDSPYDHVIRSAWKAFKQVPVQSNGYRTYFTYPTFYGPNDSRHPVFSGRGWVHNPAGLFAMLTDSAVLYHAYSGDRKVLERVREMLDHLIAHGTTEATDAWALVPYASSDAGNPVYRGATDTRYSAQDKTAASGRGDGVGYLEPDKVGELGYAYLTFYEVTLERKYLEAALRCADALAKNARPGDECHSPWPFRVDARTGTRIREEYSANTIGPIRLLDELLRLKLGDTRAYRRTRNLAWDWLMSYPMRNHVWTQ